MISLAASYLWGNMTGILICICIPSVILVLLPDSLSQCFAHQLSVITLIDISPELRARYFASHSISKALGNKTRLKEEAGGAGKGSYCHTPITKMFC